MFQLFQTNKKFRFFLFILLGFIIITFRACSTSATYGFPSVYLATSYGKCSDSWDIGCRYSYDLKSFHIESFLPFNIIINLISMVLLFLLIEKIRTSNKIKNNLIIFDKATFFVLFYLFLAFFLEIVMHNFLPKVNILSWPALPITFLIYLELFIPFFPRSLYSYT